MNKPLCITFAGPVGSGKTPIAYYLSCNLSLPVLNNDAMRVETQEDVGSLDMSVYLKKRDARLKQMFDNKKDFIYDASIDREWQNKAELVKEYQYKVFIISLDFSLEKLQQLFSNKNYNQFDHLEKTYSDHQNFLAEYSEVVNLSLTDDDFEDRLELSLQAVKNWLQK